MIKNKCGTLGKYIMDRLTGEEIRVLRKKTLFHGKKRLVDFSKIIIIAIVIIIIIDRGKKSDKLKRN